MSGVDEIREAAALMRERANAASPSGEGYAGGWSSYSLDDGRAEMFCGPVVDGYRTGLVFSFPDYDDCEEGGRPSSEDVAHIASWHPSVALAVADWLDSVRVPSVRHTEDEARQCPECAHYRRALRVARTYLGRTS